MGFADAIFFNLNYFDKTLIPSFEIDFIHLADYSEN